MHKVFLRPAILFAISIILLWLNFSSHLLSTLPLKKFINGEFQSERYVFSRLVYNLKHGQSAEGGFMLVDNQVDMLQNSVERDDYTEYKRRLSENEISYSPYLSHYGLQDDLVFPIWQGLKALKIKILEKARPGSRWHKRLQTLDYYYYNLVSQSLVALLNAIAIALLIRWAGVTFSVQVGWLTLGLVLLTMPVLTFYGRSLWWMMWSWFLPCLISLQIFSAQTEKGGYIRLAMAAFLMCGAVCVNTLMGYEYVAPSMMGALVPIVFYAFMNNWSVRQWFVTSFIVGIGAVIGFLIAIYLHYDALQTYGVDPAQLIKSRYEMRAHGGETAVVKAGEILKSTQSSLLAVIGGYLVSAKELSIPQILFMTPFLVWLVKYFRGERSLASEKLRGIYDGFIAAIAFGMAGGIAMLMILKGHAYIHGYDIVIWAIPTNIFLLIFYAFRIMGVDKIIKDR